ncbi:MAG: PEP/pyruvate-binding domain-containing protein [Bacillota bacterium]
MRLVCDLTELCRDDLATAGGKGAQLGELIRHGWPVPPGFVVLTPAYRSFVTANRLQPRIAELLTRSRVGSSELERISSDLRELFLKGAVPPEVEAAILAAYRGLGEGSVAVRSSATAEDLPTASFAGQQESFLGVTGERDLLDAVRRCWSSLWTARAMAYRAEQSIGDDAVSLAVVVQRMVPADAAGVLFSADPVTGDRSRVVINASWGLGDLVVGGRVSPDTLEADKLTGRLLRVTVGTKEVQRLQDPHGIVEVPVDPVKRSQVALTEPEVERLVRMARQVEEAFGAPQDIEWAIAGDQIFLLQARPITTLTRKEPLLPPGDDTWGREEELPPQPFDLWTRTNVGENLPFPVTPLTATAFPAVFNQSKPPAQGTGTRFQPIKRLYGRMYVNEGGLMHVMSEEWGLPGFLLDKVWGSRRRGAHRSTAGFRPWRLLRRLPELMAAQLRQPRQAKPRWPARQFFTQIDAWVAEFDQLDLRCMTDSALWEVGLPLWKPRGEWVWSRNLAIAARAMIAVTALEKLAGWWSGKKGIHQDLITGLSGIYSAEVGPALWEMAHTLQRNGHARTVLENGPKEALELLRRDPATADFWRQLDAFLARHGHRCPNEVEFLYPRWKDAPEEVIALVAGYLRAGDALDPEALIRSQRLRREQRTEEIRSALGPLRRYLFNLVLRKAQESVRARDNSRYYVTRFFYPVRQVLAEFGRRWAERGWLNLPEEVFFLTLQEVEVLARTGDPHALPGEIRAMVRDRRLAYDYWLHVTPPEAIGPDGRPVEETAEGEVLEGLPASGGKVRGRARLVQDPRQAALLQPGDILVTQATDPGWTPVFPLVRGLVLEIGGQLSHGAIVAREYGVPAVVNVAGATRRIRDGESIVVDGDAGRVYLEGSA